ncbi:trypsin-like serine protease [Hyalangium minutum]|uniref:trypsin-like serine protease n=1 Tax=Hyalangium minutum TaxID=394096 RepID=UPI0014704F92|nr:trypsin-like serine protease [Hyalangium minutum]
MDKENRYASAVVVGARLGEQSKRCSGVLVDRRAVLTAAHCLCAPQSASLMDASNCAQRAAVSTILYTPVPGLEDEASSSSALYLGVVHPHPAFRVLLNDHGEVVSSVADLAMIHLESPVEEAISPVLMARTEAQPPETLIIAGQAYDEIYDRYDQNRRFSRNTATRPPVAGDSRILVRQPSGHLYKGDSGGPCLREDSGHSLLVGVSSRNLGRGAACTSIHGYQAWVRSELRHTAEGQVP